MTTFGLTRTVTTCEFDVTTEDTVPERVNGRGAYYATIRPTRALVTFTAVDGLPAVSRTDATGVELTGPRQFPATADQPRTDARDIGTATFDLTAPNGRLPEVVSELLDFVDDAFREG